MLLDHTCQNCYSDHVIFLTLMTTSSLIFIEHHYAWRNCHHPRTSARNSQHSAARICSHSSYTEGRAPCGHRDPCHSNSCHSCKSTNLECFCLCNLLKATIFILRYFYVLSHISAVNLICAHQKILNFVGIFLQETLENVKKCRNFLSTLIKLASSGKQSSETTANVKELVKKLLVNFLPHLFMSISSSHLPSLC